MGRNQWIYKVVPYFLISAVAIGAADHVIDFNENPRSCISHDLSRWGYFGQLSEESILFPNHWRDEFSTCGKYRNRRHRQSPIELPLKASTKKPSDVKFFGYPKFHYKLQHNCHTVQATPINVEGGTEKRPLTISGIPYKLLQFHIHTPSEHVLRRQKLGVKNYPMEIHFVHGAVKGNGKIDNNRLAVVGVLVDVGKPDSERDKLVDAGLNQLIANYQVMKEKPVNIDDVVMDINKILEKPGGYYRYEGSLTTPPCSEVVKWIVYKDPIIISLKTLAAMQNKRLDVGFANARPAFLPTKSHAVRLY